MQYEEDSSDDEGGSTSKRMGAEEDEGVGWDLDSKGKGSVLIPSCPCIC